MRKVIAATNITIDGVNNHTEGLPDDEIHDHYTALLNQSETILYGRKTYELMLYWRDLLKHPAGKKSFDDFAIAINRIEKIVFSHTLKDTDWPSAKLVRTSPVDLIKKLRQQKGCDILVGSRSIIIQLLSANLINELQLCIHPAIAGTGAQLFTEINFRKMFHLSHTKTFKKGAVLLCYSPL